MSTLPNSFSITRCACRGHPSGCGSEASSHRPLHRVVQGIHLPCVSVDGDRRRTTTTTTTVRVNKKDTLARVSTFSGRRKRRKNKYRRDVKEACASYRLCACCAFYPCCVAPTPAHPRKPVRTQTGIRLSLTASSATADAARHPATSSSARGGMSERPHGARVHAPSHHTRTHRHRLHRRRLHDSSRHYV